MVSLPSLPKYFFLKSSFSFKKPNAAPTRIPPIGPKGVISPGNKPAIPYLVILGKYLDTFSCITLGTNPPSLSPSTNLPNNLSLRESLFFISIDAPPIAAPINGPPTNKPINPPIAPPAAVSGAYFLAVSNNSPRVKSVPSIFISASA